MASVKERDLASKIQSPTKIFTPKIPYNPGTDCVISLFDCPYQGISRAFRNTTFVSITGQELTPGAYLRLLNYILWDRTELESHDALEWAFTAVTMPL